jgi:uncharacterized membrane protein YczE
MAALSKAKLQPLPLRVRPVRRLVQLYVGLALYATSMALQVRSRLGNHPWDVFHQGLARHLHLSFGTITILVGLFVLLLWIPLRQRPGLGTVSNVVCIGVFVDLALAAIPTPSLLAVRIAYLVGSVLLCGLATGLYIGARLGPGPRDGLMTGLASRGYSLRLVRTSIEVCVVAVGWLLGGTVGLGTLVYALAIGPVVQLLLPRLIVMPRPAPEPLSAAPELSPAPSPAT